MFHSIISDYDVFFAGEYPQSDSVFYGYKENCQGAAASSWRGVYMPNGFFSTDPKDYLKML